MRYELPLIVALGAVATGCAMEVETAAVAEDESTAEAASEWTRADCMVSYRINVEICNRLPSARERCFVACQTMLAVCLAGAKG